MSSPRLPPGVRDYLPVAAARRRGLAASAAAEIERWGYRGIITPLYEYADVLARGMGGAVHAMRFVEPASGEVVALRPDLTPQVARLVATRMHDEPGPVRLYYQGSVVRLDGARREIFQVGVELIDAPQPGGDLEVVALAEATLAALGISDYTVDLGHAAVARAALSELGLDDEAMAALQLALMRKDGAAVAQLATQARVSEPRKQLLRALPSLYGGTDVLARARSLVEDATARAAVDELALLCTRLGALGPATRLSIDLGEVRGFDYYTGTRFSLYAEGVGGALASGGRYDGLVARYGRPARAAGFALDVDRVAELLKLRGVPAPRQTGGVLVAGDPVAAARAAAELRQKGERAILDLDEPAASDGDLLRRAAARDVGRVAVASPTGIRWLNGSS
ncbi:MAG: ATP phosphoribosyltransferase regulatory subunit [Myxococcales bacterium]|nr:ATP phosphoribosyltransferase regulatory subunit [Myxococcales bacterium]